MSSRKILKIVVLMGGSTPEYEISLLSGREVVRNLPSKYEAIPVVVSRDGSKWYLTDRKTLLLQRDPLKLFGSGEDIDFNKGKSKLISLNNIRGKVDVVFIAMHGRFGEDGAVQGMLELAGIPYTGPGVLASALGMDKLMFRKVMSSAGIPIPKYVVFKKGQKISNLNLHLGEYPYFVKPHNQGSSVGNTIVRSRADLKSALNKALEFSDTALIDEYIEGIEITCGILGNENPVALPLVEIKPLKGEFFDYDSKYLESGAEEIVPAIISKKLTKEIQNIALKVYKEIGCRGFSRVDFIVKQGKDPIVLEINTIPGLTPMSLLPKAAEAYGLSFTQLLDKIINYAI